MVLTFAQTIGSSITGSARRQSADSAGQAYKAIVDRYELYERYYDNEMYETVQGGMQAIKAATGLYRNTRAIHNPLRRAADWYPGHVYPGAMTTDGLPLPDGTPCCVPFAEDTDEEVRLAMVQGLLWANWGSNRFAVVRDLVVLGDVFAEIDVDYERNKVMPKFIHPKYVCDVEWNGSGDIVAYTLEIPMFDEDTKQSYKWGKRVDPESITTLKDGKPQGYDGQPATIENPWGFVPAAWAQFRNVGGQHGASLIDGVRGKIDQLNSSVSSIHDYIGKLVAQGILIVAKGGRKAFEEANSLNTPGLPTATRTNPEAGRQEVRYIFAPEGTVTSRLIEDIGLAASDPHIARLQAEIESDLPESTIDERIQGMGTPPSGRALRMMFGGPEARLAECVGNADHLLIKLMQMTTSIGGEQANSGAWGLRSQMSEAQQRFLPFDLRSFDRGLLSDVTLLPRELFPDSQQDRIQTAMQLESLKTPTGRRLAGMGKDDIAALSAEQDAAQANAASFLGSAFNSGRGL